MPRRAEIDSGYRPGDHIDHWLITESLHASQRSLVLRVVDGEGRKAVLKFLRAALPGARDLARFRYEYEVARRFEHAHILRPEAMSSHAGRPYLVLPDLGAVSLREQVRRQPLECVTVLEIAAALVDALQAIHQQGVVHRDISLSNILISRDCRGQVRPAVMMLSDFGIAAEITNERPPLVRADFLEGSLATLAPEQTGRMSRDVDYRADFYSLGATLFEALTGTPVFAFNDAAQAVHAHLALTPELASERRADVFEPLAELINHCLQKEPEARYQSHTALQHDIALCLEALRARHELPDFRPGRADRLGQFQLSGKLYGRAPALQQLAEAFESAALGSCRLVAIAGFSGIGKTALVTAAHRSLLAQRGNFASAKFNQFGQYVPYGALLSTLSQRANQVLALAPAQQALWRARLQDQLGVNAGVVVEAIPAFRPLLPEAPPVLALGPAESENRFLRTLRLCLGALACDNEPQTLFLDDMQWADRASRRLLREWVADTGLSHTLFVIAYRDNEVGPDHPFAQDLIEYRELGGRFLALTMGPLSLINTQQLLADSLHHPLGEVADLAALCLTKTAGNPFFLRRFVEDLVQRKLVFFDAATQQWAWSLAQIERTQMAENVVALMIEQFKPLPAATRQTLTVAAFLGAQFDLVTLATALEQTPAAVAAELLPALQAQLVVPGSSLYRYATLLGSGDADAAQASEVRYSFAHDRVQEAAYQLVSEAERLRLRLKIGRLLRSELAPAALPFHVVNHLNAALALITDAAERADLAQANEHASLQAMNTAAFELAADYADIATQLQGEQGWQARPDAMLRLHLHAARMAYLAGRMPRMDELLNAALARVTLTTDRARLLEVRIEACYAQGQLTDTLDLGLEALAMLDAELPQAATPQEVVALIGCVRAEVTAVGLPALAALPAMQDARILQLISISAKMTAASYIARPGLLPLLTVFQVRLMMAHGHVPSALSAFSVLGLMFAEFLGDYRLAYGLGRMTMEQVRNQGWQQVYAHAGFSFDAFLHHWIEPLTQSLPGLMRTYRNGLEFGNLRHAGLGLYVHDYHAFLAGQPLPALLRSLQQSVDSLRSMRQPVAADYDSALLATVRELTLPELPPQALERAEFSGEALADTYRQRKDQTGLMFLHAWRALLHFLADRPALALEESRAAAALFAAARGMHAVPMVVFIGALSALRCAADDAARIAALAECDAALQRLGRWNAAGPGTFSAKYHLLAAEIARARGQDPRPDFDAAIAASGRADTGTSLDAALAEGLLGRHLAAAQPGDPQAQAALAQARLHWLQWGAPGLAQALAQPAAQHPAAAQSSVTATQQMGRADLVDLSSLMKAVQAITVEADLPGLLQRLVQVVAENAGAQRAAIVLAAGPQTAGPRLWALQADARLSGTTEVRVLQNLALEEAGARLPLSLLRRTLASGLTLLIHDARSDLELLGEPYFSAQGARSALSIALIKQGGIVGALYLENASIPGVFTEQRVEFLELLCANVVNAVDNARLLGELQELTASLEKRVEQRTQELRESEVRLRTILDNAPVPMTLTRRSDGVLVYANGPAGLTVNRPVSDIVGKPAQSFYRDPSERQQMLAKYQTQGLLASEETCLLAADGSDRWVMISMVPVIYNGEVADLSTIVDITERKQLEIELQRLATTDSLTGVANRRSFISRASIELARSRRYATPLALIMLDIDNFKLINDSMGHGVGDEAILAVAHRCSKLVRGQDVVGRLGGEEFAVLLPQTDLPAAVVLAERLRQRFAGIVLRRPGVPERGLTASFGVAVLQPQDSVIDELLVRADEALYEAKNSGRDRVVGQR